MKKSLFFLLLASVSNLSALPEGSPHRCTQDNWAQVDTLLPPRSQNGGYADTAAWSQKITITPQQMLQSAVDHLLSFSDMCNQPIAGRGGFEDNIGTDLCERLAVYNMGAKTPAPSPEDTAFLESISKMCRPTTTRWWNYPLVVHVALQPTPAEYKELEGVLH